MQCTNNDIQELLPAYEQQLLDRDDRARVEQHLAGCEDCASELALIRMLADEPVPDLGEAFWTALPGRVYREVREQEQRKRPGGLMDLLGGLVLPRWTWAAAAVLFVAVAAWFLVSPEPVEIARTTAPDSSSLSGDMLDAESLDMTELDDAQLDSLGSWAARELAAIQLQEEPGDLFTNGFDASTDDKLAEMTAQELEHLSGDLDEYEYEEDEEEG